MFRIRFGCYLLRFHLASDSLQNNNIPEIFFGVHGFTAKTVKSCSLSEYRKKQAMILWLPFLGLLILCTCWNSILFTCSIPRTSSIILTSTFFVSSVGVSASCQLEVISDMPSILFSPDSYKLPCKGFACGIHWYPPFPPSYFLKALLIWSTTITTTTTLLTLTLDRN